jgi:hypothetical protein
MAYLCGLNQTAVAVVEAYVPARRIQRTSGPHRQVTDAGSWGWERRPIDIPRGSRLQGFERNYLRRKLRTEAVRRFFEL